MFWMIELCCMFSHCSMSVWQIWYFVFVAFVYFEFKRDFLQSLCLFLFFSAKYLGCISFIQLCIVLFSSVPMGIMFNLFTTKYCVSCLVYWDNWMYCIWRWLWWYVFLKFMLNFEEEKENLLIRVCRKLQQERERSVLPTWNGSTEKNGEEKYN